jgi:hypothetical protein
MNKWQKAFLFATILVIVLGVIGKLVDKIREQAVELELRERTVTALQAAEKTYLTKLGDAAVKRQVLELSEKELRKSNADLHKEIKALNIRVKDALSATKTITKTIVDERVRVDTVNNVILAEHKDAWNIIRSEQVGDSARLYYEGRDSIVGVISVRKKRFLFFRWGVKAVEYDLSNKNPKTRINIDIAVKFK